jgi:sugar O-acyltransferase (sialic acid O-acetyltransferase NeuD family)
MQAVVEKHPLMFGRFMPLGRIWTVGKLQLVGFGDTFAQEIIQSLKRRGDSFSVVTTNEPFGSTSYSFSEEPNDQEATILSQINPGERIAIAELLSTMENIQLGLVVDPTAVVADNSTIGHGGYVNSLVSIGAKTSFGCHVFINRSSSIAHDCKFDSFVSTGPGVIICGGVSIGFASFIGAGAVVRDGVSIGKHAYIGAGAVVIRDVSDYEVVVGNPARPIRKQSIESNLDRCPWC